MDSTKSPFPGMDPYLEKFWRDVHHRLCTYACDALQPQIRPTLLAQIDERLIIESDIADDRVIIPDVRIVQDRKSSPLPDQGTSVAVAEPPLLLSAEDDTPTEGFINIVDPSEGNRLVTVIEFLSPTNKQSGEGHKQYRQKQSELRDAGVSLVEIDLIRGGEWTVMVPKRKVPQSHRTLYRACVHRGWCGQQFEFYRAALQQRLPIINVPLRQKDMDAKLDVQLILEQTYRNGAYDRLDYRSAPEPPLDPENETWSDQLLRDRGQR